MRKSRPKVLLLGVSYPKIETLSLFKQRPGCEGISNGGGRISLVERVVDSVKQNILTQMDGRDLARCVATEEHCHVDVYTVSQEKGAIYRDDRHFDGNFNRQTFCRTLKKHFDLIDEGFDQVILDYFWIPAGWNVQHWSRSFFKTTLVNLVKDCVLKLSRDAGHRPGRVYLPFCLHCFKEILASSSTILEHYNVSFLRKGELQQISFWKGTQQIDPDTMQGVLAKRRDQEELYCTFGPRDLHEGEDDPFISKGEIADMARKLEDFGMIRFIVLEPLTKTATTRTARQRKNTGRLRGDFVGLVPPPSVKRGFDHLKNTSVCPTTPRKSKLKRVAPNALSLPIRSLTRSERDTRSTQRKAKERRITRAGSPQTVIEGFLKEPAITSQQKQLKPSNLFP
jgi:hypothetical protein